MSPATLLDLDLGVDLTIVDEADPAAAPTATDTIFYVRAMAFSGSPAGVQEVNSLSEARTLYPNEPTVQADMDAFFNIGAARVFVSPLVTTPLAAAQLFTSQMGPGQLVAPAVTTLADLQALRGQCWTDNRIFIAQAADGTSDAAATSLADSLKDAVGARNMMLEADWVYIPGVAAGTTRLIAGSVAQAALMARSDINTGNPNLAAAGGEHTPGSGGQHDYIVGIKGERPASSQKTLAKSQVNCWRTVNNRVRKYGYWTLADLALLPVWWDIGGSRTMMAIRAQEQAVAESLMFGQVDATNGFLDRYAGALSGVLAELQRKGALYGTDQNKGYSVVVSPANNPVSQVATGLVKASIVARTSPFAGALKLTLSRRAITRTTDQ